MKKIELDIRELDIGKSAAWIWFHDPKGLNTMTLEYFLQLENALEEARSCQCIVFATTAKNFSVGLDLKEVANQGSDALYKIALRANKVFREIADLKIPTLALLQGYAVGGAIEMTAGCDFRYAAADTKISVPGIKIGIFNPASTLFHLPRLIGMARATELILSGSMIDAAKAEHWGLVSGIYKTEELVHAGEAWTEFMLELDPVGLAANKKLLRLSLDVDRETFQRIEDAEAENCFNREEAVELMRNFFT